MISDHGSNSGSLGGSDGPGQPVFGNPPPNWQGQSAYGGPSLQPPQRKSQKTVIILIAVIAVTALVLIGVIAAILVGSSSSKAESVLSSCNEEVPLANSAKLRSDGRSIQFDWGSNPDASDILMLSCLLEETGAPSAVEARMESTRALDGTQEAEWEDWSAFWTYHPSSGFNATFTSE